MSTLPLFEANKGGRGPRVLRVAALNRLVRLGLEQQWRDLWVEGELSDVRVAASGHVYCSLNDEQEPAQLRVVMFRTDARRAKARLGDGERVRLRGMLSLFEARGTFQLIARLALPAGWGALHARFERLARKLQAEGLLDPARKRVLPKWPRVVGLVTSPSGAAVHDVSEVAAKRCPVRLVVAPCTVQGRGAEGSIIEALEAIQQLRELDVVIIGRGGGASDDLSVFNSEGVARAIAGCRVPTVSAVGHEVDVTLADLVADVRAATPSNAAELVVPDREALLAELEAHTRALEQAMELRLERLRLRLERSAQRLPDPTGALVQARRGLEALEHARDTRLKLVLQALRDRVEVCQHRLLRHDVRRSLERDRAALTSLALRLRAATTPALGTRRGRFERAVAALDALSPLAILQRGYAIASDSLTGKALTDAAAAAVGQPVAVRLHRGVLHTRVEHTT
ncbi:MAG: exodeoxyribonuclease VII large subunit [Proteobacteria bacterium]|nr:exodeoxyribonuclease VII large subunit [Pseudomonadota bacterium]